MPVPVDPLASLHLGAIELEVGPLTVLVPPRTAKDWLTVTVEHNGRLAGYLHLLSVLDRLEVIGSLMDGHITETDLSEAIWDLLAVATGFDWWWVAHRLLMSTAADWANVGGILLRTGFDLETRPVGALVMTVYGLYREQMVKAMTAEERAAAMQELCMPPKGLPDWAEQMQIVGAQVLGDMTGG